MASLIHTESCESIKEELDLFSVPPSQTSLEQGKYVQYNPVSILSNNGPIEFLIPGENSSYIDLSNTLLHVRAKIKKQDGSVLGNDSNVAPVCNFLHALWSQCDLYLNGVLVTQASNTYPYRAYIETLLSFGEEAKKSQLSCSLWYGDTASKFDSSTNANKGFQKRKELASGSKELDMIGKLHLDLCFQNRYLLSGVEVKLRLNRLKDVFCLMGSGDYMVELTNASLYCRKAVPSDAVQLSHIRALQSSSAKYPIRRVEVKSFTVPRGTYSISKENLFLGQLPRRIVFGLVENEAFNGAIGKNPFNFKHCSVNFVSLYRDGEQIPANPLQLNYSQNRYIRSFLSLFTDSGLYYNDSGNGISRDSFPLGHSLYAIDLTPDLSASCSHFQLVKTGNIRLELHFSTPPAETMNVIIHAEFDNLLQIDRDRNVLTDY